MKREATEVVGFLRFMTDEIKYIYVATDYLIKWAEPYAIFNKEPNINTKVVVN